MTRFDLGISISRVMYSDLGEYTCVIEYMGTMEEASAILTVEGRQLLAVCSVGVVARSELEPQTQRQYGNNNFVLNDRG